MQDPLMRETVSRLHVGLHVVGVSATLMGWVCLLLLCGGCVCYCHGVGVSATLM